MPMIESLYKHNNRFVGYLVFFKIVGKEETSSYIHIIEHDIVASIALLYEFKDLSEIRKKIDKMYDKSKLGFESKENVTYTTVITGICSRGIIETVLESYEGSIEEVNIIDYGVCKKPYHTQCDNSKADDFYYHILDSKFILGIGKTDNTIVGVNIDCLNQDPNRCVNKIYDINTWKNILNKYTHTIACNTTTYETTDTIVMNERPAPLSMNEIKEAFDFKNVFQYISKYFVDFRPFKNNI